MASNARRRRAGGGARRHRRHRRRGGAAERLRLKIVAASIQDLPNNVTRFLVVSHDLNGKPTGDDKTSILFAVPHESGALFKVLEPFAQQRINLSTIESRPLKGRAWEYVFFIDLAGHSDEPRMAEGAGGAEATGAVRQGAGLVSRLALAGGRGATMNVKNLVRPWLHSLEPYPPGKPIDELEREYGITDSIKLASNENPLGPSPKALAALQAALADMHRYPDGNCFYLRRALARKLRVSPESLVFGNGSNEIIELIVRTFLHAGEEAVMADQAFVIYRMVVQAQGGRGIIVPLRNFTHDLEAMADAITPATRLVFLANPNNPTGTIVFRDAVGGVPRRRAARRGDRHGRGLRRVRRRSALPGRRWPTSAATTC